MLLARPSAAQESVERPSAHAEATGVACERGARAAQDAEVLPLEVVVNSRAYEPTSILVAPPSGPHFARTEDVIAWGISPLEATVYKIKDATWLCLEALGAEVTIDMARLAAEIEFDPRAFRPQDLEAVREDTLAVTRSSGGFLNYDIRADRTDGDTSVESTWEGGLFGRYGLLTSSALTEERGHTTTRLDTAWRYDDENSVTSWVIGDTLSRSSTVTPSVRMAGVQFARNFANRPLMITYPTPLVQGTAVVPSTIDILVNNARTYSAAVAPGPYSITDLPVPSGVADVRIVTRDLLGRETVQVVPFIGEEELLRKGLSDFSYEAGWLRDEYGVKSNEYDDFVALGTHRYGVTDRVTLSAHAELLDAAEALGGAIQFAVPLFGVVTLGGGASSSPDEGTGHITVIGFSRHGRRLQMGASVERRSDNFIDVSVEPGIARLHDRDRAFISWSSTARWSLGAQATRTLDTQGEVIIASIVANVSLFRNVSLTFGVSRIDVDADRQTAATAFVSMPLGPRDYLSMTAEHIRQTGSDTWSAQYGRNLLESDSTGYDALFGGTDGAERWLLRAEYQNSAGLFGVEAQETQDFESQSVYARGGVAVAGGALKLSRYLDSSFAILKVADFPDVDVYSNNQLVARTDRNGEAVVPHLTPFLSNSVSFEPDDIPAEGVFEDNRALLKLPYGMGSFYRMDIRRELSATLVLVQHDGTPVPAGAQGLLEGNTQTFYIGSDGRAFVSGLARGATQTLHVSAGPYSCKVAIHVPEDFTSASTLGPLTCE